MYVFIILTMSLLVLQRSPSIQRRNRDDCCHTYCPIKFGLKKDRRMERRGERGKKCEKSVPRRSRQWANSWSTHTYITNNESLLGVNCRLFELGCQDIMDFILRIVFYLCLCAGRFFSGERFHYVFVRTKTFDKLTEW